MYTKPSTPTWRDIDLSFMSHPGTGDLIMKTDLNSIFQSLENLIITGVNDFIMCPGIGGGIEEMLFEINTTLGLSNLRTRIENTIKAHESRIELDAVVVETDPSNIHAIDVTVTFYALNQPALQTTTVRLSRFR